MGITQFDDRVTVGTVGSTGAAAAIAGSTGRVWCAPIRRVAASATITNTNVRTAFDNGNFTVPANACAAGTIFKLYAQGICPSTNAADTLLIELRFGAAGTGGTVVCATPTVNVSNNDIFIVEARIVIRTIGAGGTFVGAGFANLGVPGTDTTRTGSVGSTAVDTTAARDITLTATWSAANAGNQVRLDVFNVLANW